MYKGKDAKVVYSPSDLILFFNSTYASWMDRFHLEFPDAATPDAQTEEQELFRRLGLEHERAFLQSLKAEGRDICEITPDERALEETRAAMRRGREIIYQGKLASERFVGVADFLERAPGSSALGDHRYVVWDTKLARNPKPYFLIQLCCYAEMLEAIQGIRPEQVWVVLGGGERQAFRTDDYFFYYRALKKGFLETMATFDPEKRPAPDLGGNYGRWESHAREYFEKNDHLSRVANITRNQIRRLEAAGIKMLTALSETTSNHVPGISDASLAKLKDQASLQLRSKDKALPECHVIPPDPENPRTGLALLPPPSDLDVFFDMEGYPYAQGEGLEYLFGAAYRENVALQFIDWWAFDPEEEKSAFEGFIDWAYERWRRDAAMHIYHYAPYEISAMRRLMGRHGTCENQVDDLLRNEVFVDLYSVVRGGLRVGTPSYSIKDLEALYQEKRTGEVKTAGDSIVYFQRWLASGDPRRWQDSAHLKNIRDYTQIAQLAYPRAPQGVRGKLALRTLGVCLRSSCKTPPGWIPVRF